MAIEIGIDDTKRKEIAEGLSRLLADTYTLYLTTHNFHWNVTGRMFNSLHAMFMVQYTELWNAVDPIAERIRQEVSETTFGTPGQPLRLTVSVGVAGIPHDASDAQRLKDAAFGAIAHARSLGGNQISIFPR